MFCPNCGRKTSGPKKFCPDCGHKIEVETKQRELDKIGSANESRANKKQPSNKALIELQERYKNTGNTSIALSVLGIILSFGLNLANYNLEETIVGVIIFLPLIAPFYYFGKKLRDKGIDDLSFALKLSKGMLIYTGVFIIINLLMGGIGWLWFFVLYYFYRSYRETKALLGNR